MPEFQPDSFAAQNADHAAVLNLLEHYSFDLNGYLAAQILQVWSRTYSDEWIRLAIVEALYQGRYKAISVEQILSLWQRRGEPKPHFTYEFERLVCDNFPRNFAIAPGANASNPKPLPPSTPNRGIADPVARGTRNPQLSLPEVPESPLRRMYRQERAAQPQPPRREELPRSEVPGAQQPQLHSQQPESAQDGDALVAQDFPTGQAVPGEEPGRDEQGRSRRFFNHLAHLITQGEDAANGPQSQQPPLTQPPYEPNWPGERQEPIDHFVPPPEATEFHDKLRAVAHPADETDPSAQPDA